MMNDQLIKYIDGELSDGEVSILERKLSTDPDLREEYRAINAAKTISKYWVDGEIRGYMKKWNGQKQRSLWKKYSWLIALFILLMLGSLFYVYNTKPQEPLRYADSYIEPVWPVTRSIDDHISHAVSLHLGGNTDVALDLLLKADTVTTEMQYWASEIMVQVGRCPEATPILKALSQQNFNLDRVNTLMGWCEE